MTDADERTLSIQQAGRDYELSLLLDDDDEGMPPDPPEATAFDDVAMILLLFFMVTSLSIYFPVEKQTKEDHQRAIPIVDEKTLLQPPPGGSYRVFLKSAPDQSLFIEWQLLRDGAELKRGQENMLAAPGKDPEVEVAELMTALREAVEKVGPPLKENKPPDVDIVVFVNHDMPYGRIQRAHRALRQLSKHEPVFQERVMRIAWRARVLEMQ